MPRTQRHSGGARHARKRRLWPRIVAWTAGGLVVALGIGVGSVALKLQGNLQTAPLTAGTALPKEADEKQSHDALDILVIGSDSRDADNAAYGDDDGGRRSDALMLVHIAKDDARIDVLQIPRDTLTQLPACEDTGSGAYAGGYGMINSALMYGESCSVAAVQDLTGVNIEHFISIDFVGFKTMVQAIDGLPICLPEAMQDSYAGLDLPAGEQVLDGEQALSLARTRHAVGDGSDLARLGNQQKVMAALMQKITSAEVLTRPDRLVNLLDAITKSLTVDSGLGSIGNLSSLAARVASVKNSDITFVAMPAAAAPTDPNRVVPTEAAQAIFTNIAADAPLKIEGEEGADDSATADPSASATPSDEPSVATTTPVLVLNGTMTQGLATSTSTELTEAGFVSGGVGDAAVSEKTQLLITDTAEARATAEALVKKMGYDLEPVVDANASGVTLVIGDDIDEITTPVASEEAVEAEASTADANLCG
ncbi:LCP family protein [Mycetocola reblochoni]|uniref:Cell envelope-associated transcriptional attenuator LytR-CpsA-Psr, subfamily A1 (As in PMID19099556) n=1 Tax=Mycetocola reblochoni REB411 TaxID=1255698 RepID=A0A1R4JND9_9MICO|nr:LCP family protein [Mycetocola reblochoni]SJN33444.1 Cell envelope-associated transcriptional attenuator LytR-CpsA-Psr, subfamily A1 (as in PMID19099556) [Mycetocola reblochoni REB411]